MAFTPEDGTGLSGANSFADVAAADTYHGDRGNATWTALAQADKEAALVKATDYLTGRYADDWRGDRNSDTQALSWPRTGAYYSGDSERPVASDAVPQAVQDATALLAYESTVNPLQPANVGSVQGPVKREKLGTLEVEYTDGYVRTGNTYPAVDGMLSELVMRSPNSVTLERS